MTATAREAVVEEWLQVRWFLWIGAACVVAGGLVAAVTGPLDLADGSWLAAFLVLIGGVAPIGLGIGQAWLHPQVDAVRLRVELVAWYLGVAATIVGTLIAVPVVATAGSIAVAVALATFLVSVGRAPASGPRTVGLLYRVVAALVMVSIPVGVALSWIRHG